ncbi:MAG: efflux RND transporter periplasmic adaptor subunit [Candidatus Krumholzibacteriales bacterium]
MSRGKSRKGKVIWITIAAVAVIAAGMLIFGRGNGNGAGPGPTVKVERGDIIEKALAVGSIVPENEISVKSKISGVVEGIFKEQGERVERGAPLIEISPDPTPLELAEAKRNVEMSGIELENAGKRLSRVEELLQKRLISDDEFEDVKEKYDKARLRYRISRERLQLLEEGKVDIAGSMIESIIRAPISGFILERNVNVGDPVVPLTSYQAGTVLMTIANMDSLLFKGTVDEIDVGKLTTGMPVSIKVGALQDREISGRLRKISLKAREENNSRMFPVEIDIDNSGMDVLRAGYSANAEIIINEARDVLTVPERVVYFSGDSTYVEVPGSDGSREKVLIETGLSDAIRIEVPEGLEEGQKVLEKPQKEV